MEATDTTSSLLNGVTLKSKVTVSDHDLKLIKAALKKCTNSKMTKAEKAAAIYVYVHNAATDVKPVSGKTSSGSPHRWCQLTIAGTDYMIDPQVGGRFLITYESMCKYINDRSHLTFLFPCNIII